MTGLQSNMCHAITTKAAHTEEGRSRGQRSVGKRRLYEILYNLNQGFEQVLDQLQLLEKLGPGHEPWKAHGVMVEEKAPRSTSNQRLAEREERGWAYFGRLRHEREKKLRDPQDLLIESDGLRQRLKGRRIEGHRNELYHAPLRESKI